MQNSQQVALNAPLAQHYTEPALASEKQKVVYGSSPLKRKVCAQRCLQQAKGFTFEEKSCLIDCYQKIGFPSRKVLEL
jgi:hypothetical protein